MNDRVHFKFRLYVAGDGPNSAQAIANLHALCCEYLKDRHEIEIVDVLCEPQRALDDSIFLTPMLLKFSPAPVCKIVGTLDQREILMQALDLKV
jgi:circadian clock protein KaiB